MKKVLVVFLTVVFLSSTFGTFVSAANSTPVYLSGAKLVQGRTLLPLRDLFEVLGASVQWDQNTRTVIATKDNTRVVLKIGSKQGTVNNKAVSLDVPAQIIDKKTMIPVRFASEALGAKIEWNSKTQEVTVVTGNQTIIISTGTKIPTTANDGTWLKTILANELQYGSGYEGYFVGYSQEFDLVWFGFQTLTYGDELFHGKILSATANTAIVEELDWEDKKIGTAEFVLEGDYLKVTFVWELGGEKETVKFPIK